MAAGCREGRACPQRAGGQAMQQDQAISHSRGALDYYMRKSAQSAKILGMTPERGHSCPQQRRTEVKLSNFPIRLTIRELLRTRMSALRFGSGYAGLGTARPTIVRMPGEESLA